MFQTLFDDGRHRCLMVHDLADGHPAVQSNQFLVIDGGQGALIDPGGNLAYNELQLMLARVLPAQRLTALIASHADPDIIASLDRWMTSTPAPVYISTVWERFVPHFCKPGKTEGRIIGIPDRGLRIPLGGAELVAVPAHFLHAEGNFHFWDAASGILFTGDLGVSVGVDPSRVIQHLDAAHVAAMEPFHRRYMAANKILRLWARMARGLRVKMLVPQHGAPMAGAAVSQFIDWVEQLACGVDLMGESDYQLPV